MKKLVALCLMIFSLVVVTGCSSDIMGNSKSSKSFFTEPGLVAKAISDLKETPELKGKDIQVFQNVLINDADGIGNMIDINVLVPGSNDKVNNYKFQNGKWSKPSPVQITGEGDMADNVMPIDSIDYNKVTDIYKAAEEKAKTIENGKVKKSLIYIYYIDDHKYNAYINIEGSREKYTAKFDAQGNLLEMKKD